MTSQNGSIDGRELVSTVNGTVHPDPEVPERLERARRRQFTVGYKPRILSEADAARTTGEIGALPRREGLYSSHLAAWRRQREEGILNALSPRRRGRPTSWPEQRELARLRQENERLSQRLVAAEAVIEVPKKGCVVARAGRAEPSERRAALMASVTELVPIVGVEAACEAVGVARAGFYREARRRRAVSAPLPPPSPRHEGAAGELSVPGAAAVADRAHPRALSPAEQQAVRDVLHSERFRDAAPAAVYATLPDEGTYLASERTMYRLLAAEGETRSRRDQLAHPTYTKPELLATAPNRVWSWDITKPLGPAKWTYFYLYVILDIYSRYVVGWMVAHREHADLAERLIAATVAKQGVPAGQLTLHADRGSSMTSKPVAFLLADLGVAKTHSRPHVSNDTPYSEAQSKTLKYRPGFPDRFASIEEARAFCQDFFRWYNAAHRHSGIGLLTPEVVHYGQAQAAYDSRAQVLATAYAAHPERFVRQAPSPPQLPTAARINPPTPVSDPLNPSEEVRQSFPAPRVSNLLTGSAHPPVA